jgi:V-type H+-transporting ATPase subunit a
VYPIGLDPKWYVATNELMFFNSFKMKFAVIFGVIQMLWGILMKGVNTLNFRLWTDFIFEFLPQITFLTVTFGYMDFLIVKKWNTDFTGDLRGAPAIINTMINMPLKFGGTDGKPLWDMASQEDLQRKLLIISLICVPVMLIPKPLILYCQHAMSSRRKNPVLDEEERLRRSVERRKREFEEGPQPGHGHGDHFDFGEIFVHQIIETIEFVLGSISNTASYLRLWALSLAHGQLSKVFFQKTIGGGIENSSIIATMVGWVMFFNITLGIIMAMDMMECFLHALRLQWVEF